MRIFLFWVTGVFFAGVLAAQPGLQTGYAVLSANPAAAAPEGHLLFSQKSGTDVLVWEAGVEAAQPLNQGIIFVDQSPGTRTGLALVNLAGEPVPVSLQLRRPDGSLEQQTERWFQGGEQLALFLDELFPNLEPAFTGALVLLGQAADPTLAALALRQNGNARGEPVFLALPVTELSGAEAASLIFPHLVLNQQVGAELVLLNPGSESVSGSIRFFDSSGAELDLEARGKLTSEVQYHLEPLGSEKISLRPSRREGAGYGVLVPADGRRVPEAALFLQYRKDGALQTQAAIAAGKPLDSVRIFVDQSGTRTGVAMVNGALRENLLTFELKDSRGISLAQGERVLASVEHLALFCDELFPQIPPGFAGILEIRAALPFMLAPLKLTLNQRGDPVLTSLPVIRAGGSAHSSQRVFPHLAFGQGLSSRFLILDPLSSERSSAVFRFHAPDGQPMTVPVRGDWTAEVEADPGAGAALDLPVTSARSIRGRLQDAVSGTPLSGALISGSHGSGNAVSDSGGEFVLSTPFTGNPPPGFELSICATGYAAQAGIAVETFTIQPLEIFLVPSADTRCRGEPAVTILEASIPGDEIRLELTPLGAGGRLTLEAHSVSTVHRILTGDRWSGLQREPFDRDRLPVGAFTHLRARWEVGGSSASVDFPHAFQVLGDYLHTRYNIPNEAECTGSPSPFCFNGGTCSVTRCLWSDNGVGKSGWIEEVLENGSGYSVQVGFVSLEWFCTPPAGCAADFRNLTDEKACPACPSGTLLEDQSVAVRADHPDLDCGDRVFISEVGVRTVTDYGQLPGLDQLDHFAGVSGCNAPASIGRRRTIKLP